MNDTTAFWTSHPDLVPVIGDAGTMTVETADDCTSILTIWADSVTDSRLLWAHLIEAGKRYNVTAPTADTTLAEYVQRLTKAAAGITTAER